MGHRLSNTPFHGKLPLSLFFTAPTGQVGPFSPGRGLHSLMTKLYQAAPISKAMPSLRRLQGPRLPSVPSSTLPRPRICQCCFAHLVRNHHHDDMQILDIHYIYYCFFKKYSFIYLLDSRYEVLVIQILRYSDRPSHLFPQN